MYTQLLASSWILDVCFLRIAAPRRTEAKKSPEKSSSNSSNFFKFWTILPAALKLLRITERSQKSPKTLGQIQAISPSSGQFRLYWR
mmetsp:Transcript_28272/g.49724  ORF Transcript_28272/g.49724 Transcript_28272/m.49724 type:complete len:87 (-) Transcript_28272:915-1175(-)